MDFRRKMSTHSKMTEEDETPALSQEGSETAGAENDEEVLIKQQIEEAVVYRDWIDNPLEEVVSMRKLKGWRADLKVYDGEMKLYSRSEEVTPKQVLVAVYEYTSKGHAMFDVAALRLINDESASNSKRSSCLKLYSEY